MRAVRAEQEFEAAARRPERVPSAEDEDLEAAVTGIDGLARAEQSRDELAGVRHEHGQSGQLGHVAVHVDRGTATAAGRTISRAADAT